MEPKPMRRIVDYMMVRDAARFLGVTTNTLRNWEKRGVLTTHRSPITNYRLYKKEDLDNVLRSIELSTGQ